jgi:hypothetical protein
MYTIILIYIAFRWQNLIVGVCADFVNWRGLTSDSEQPFLLDSAQYVPPQPFTCGWEQRHFRNVLFFKYRTLNKDQKPSETGCHIGCHRQNSSEFIVLPTASTPPLLPIKTRNHWVAALFSKGKRYPGREANHSPQSIDGMKNEWSGSSTPPYTSVANA